MSSWYDKPQWRVTYYLGANYSKQISTTVFAKSKGLAIAKLKARLAALEVNRTITVTQCRLLG